MLTRIRLREKGNVIKSALHMFDSLCVIGYLAILMNFYKTPWSTNYSKMAAFSTAISVGVFSYYQLYRSWRSEALRKEFILIVKCWCTVVGALLFTLFALRIEQHLSRKIVLYWCVGTPIIIFIGHVSVRIILRNIRISGIDNKSCVIVGTGYLGRSVAKCIQDTPWAGIKIFGYFGDYSHELAGTKSPRILGGYEDLPEFLSKENVDYVYIALPMHRQKLIMSILSSCRTLGAELLVVPDLYSFYLVNSEVRTLGDMIVLNFNPQQGMKRVIDILFAFATIVVTSPLWLAITALIKLEDGGPVFYAHDRIRNAGRSFKCLKFRTMHRNAAGRLAEILEKDNQARLEWSKTYKLKNDPRITKIGRFLRKTSLDELPQFINVLKGEMSIVGARPIVKEELIKYYKHNGGLYCSAKPGITGPWQVGKRSDTENYDERVQLDSEYILNWSMWTDLKIIGKTFVTIFTGRGAY